MHEISLIKGLVRQVDELAQKEKAIRVTEINLRLGALTHFTAEHFQEHFVTASRGTIMEEARLIITMDSNPNDTNALDIILESIEVD